MDAEETVLMCWEVFATLSFFSLMLYLREIQQVFMLLLVDLPVPQLAGAAG